MAFSQTSKREFWQCFLERFWEARDLRSAAHLLRWPLRTHKESFPNHLSWEVGTKIWKISITTWTLSWRHPFTTVVKEPSKSCGNLSNRNIHDLTAKSYFIHVSIFFPFGKWWLPAYPLQHLRVYKLVASDSGFFETPRPRPSSCNNWGGRCTTQFAFYRWDDQNHTFSKWESWWGGWFCVRCVNWVNEMICSNMTFYDESLIFKKTIFFGTNTIFGGWQSSWNSRKTKYTVL